MKKVIIVCFLIAYTFSFSGAAMAKAYVSETGMKKSLDEPTDSETGATWQPKSARYEAAMRDLDREYQAGGLTKTEYIQRKREIDNLEL